MAFAPPFQRPFSATFDRRAAVASWLVLDNFTDADGALLNNHVIAPINNSGTIWSSRVGTWSITANKAYASTVVKTAWNVATCTPGSADVSLSVAITLAESGQYAPALVARYQDTSNYWLLTLVSDTGNTYLQIRQISGGSSTTRATSTLARINNGTTVTLTATLSGQSISATYGVTTISYSSTALQSATIHGIAEYRDNTYSTSSFYDNFQIT